MPRRAADNERAARGLDALDPQLPVGAHEVVGLEPQQHLRSTVPGRAVTRFTPLSR